MLDVHAGVFTELIFFYIFKVTWGRGMNVPPCFPLPNVPLMDKCALLHVFWRKINGAIGTGDTYGEHNIIHVGMWTTITKQDTTHSPSCTSPPKYFGSCSLSWILPLRAAWLNVPSTEEETNPVSQLLQLSTITNNSLLHATTITN